jgi:hypothetical protein
MQDRSLEALADEPVLAYDIGARITGEPFDWHNMAVGRGFMKLPKPVAGFGGAPRHGRRTARRRPRRRRTVRSSARSGDSGDDAPADDPPSHPAGPATAGLAVAVVSGVAS